ncbi:hypothetical protein HYW17_03915 [Candidatus Uhrbacteria bacterium]|nr:hypothetical protein [Candidatus Uhrbacteria bacterium]
MTDKSRSIDDIIVDPELKGQFKQLVLERVGVMPDTLQIAVGAANFTKQELTQHVRQEDEIGKQVMEMELEFLQDLASGAVYGNE